jgi:hypothetical protein
MAYTRDRVKALSAVLVLALAAAVVVFGVINLVTGPPACQSRCEESRDAP